MLPPTTVRPSCLAHRRGLPGQQRLVDVGRRPRPPRRRPGSRHRAARARRSPTFSSADRHRHHVVAVLHLGLVGEQLRQLAERVLGAHDGAHLDPVPEQHDRGEGGELPPEVHARAARASRRASSRTRRRARARSASSCRGSSRAARSTAPLRNTRPPIRKISTPNAAGMNWLPGNRGPVRPRMSCRPVENTSVGMVRTRFTQNRRRKIAGSWCDVVVALWSCAARAPVVAPCRRARAACVVLVVHHCPRLFCSSNTFSSSATAASRRVAALVEHVGDVGAQVVLDQQLVEAAQRLLDREGLRDDVDAVVLVLDHLLHAAQLALRGCASGAAPAS